MYSWKMGVAQVLFVTVGSFLVVGLMWLLCVALVNAIWAFQGVRVFHV